MNPALASFCAVLEAPPPWLLPYSSLAQRIVRAADAPSVADALNAARLTAGTPHFVAHGTLPSNEPYEAFIARTGGVPTRDNLHDLFNGLVWLSYPQIKRRLNALQAHEITLHGASGARGAVRDALTVFDENAALLRAPAELVDSLRRRNWKGLFIQQRELWQSAHLVLFGHALMEKLLQPRKAITAHVWVVTELTDEAVASSITCERLIAKPFMPLPVLGVPGWWRANEAPDFYDDAEVFRPRRAC